ncbi:hypothetical protein [Pseudonocardia sp. HH130630-07]|uniref:hypothetical protein n=1 Tax=Pseudonocardia sp. HH130630-07 TaxID=1690815 RepID=UPI0012E9CA8E|nr:hypothetical protein [Pseudonocardia sp. HH130630-07]
MNDDGTTATELPPYLALIAVDVEGFSNRRGRFHGPLSQAVTEVLAAAFHRAGLGIAWSSGQEFPRRTGDGYVVGFRSGILPKLVNPLLHALQDELAERDREHRIPGGTPMRLRVSIGVGPVSSDDRTDLSDPGQADDGSGHDRVELHRLLDCAALRELLANNGPRTYVVAALTERAYLDAVRSGYSGDGEDYYAGVDVAIKGGTTRAYLRVPHQTGPALRSGIGPGGTGPAPAGDRPDAGPPSGSGGPQVEFRGEVHRSPQHFGHGDITGTRYGDR